MLTTISEMIDKAKAIPVNLKYFEVFVFFLKRNTNDVINKTNVAIIAITNKNEKKIFIYVTPNL
ncbi:MULTISPECIES: hypothetical protein [Bacillus]|uniref:hypothetical protein n=1 Tax=Bacillus TaxID=1386 RepID=UPI001F0A6783|nr:hypothetical protein [Bacillus pseudomycoides]MCR8856508.1 hypothetical protein [Bacillus pseudomycoides]